MSERAIFPCSRRLPDGDVRVLRDAATAIREEYRESVRWKQLRCRQVDDLGDELFCLHVGHSIQFDWTWEGSVAFRPSVMSSVPSSDANDIESISAWAGDVVEVDDTEGRLYVAAADPQNPPRIGSFCVRPFEFLAQLNALYNDPRFESIRAHLPSLLQAARGNCHPLVEESSRCGLPYLRELWQRSWCILWGPPGTGKTYAVGEQVAECLDDSQERILIVSTTNKATDESALAIGRALDRKNRVSIASQVLRVGKGADCDAFVAEGMEQLLEGGESHFRRQVGRLQQQLVRADKPEEKARLRKLIQELRKMMRDASLVAFLSSRFKAVVSTAFNAIKMITQSEVMDLLQQGKAPFTTVIIDEGGLVSRAAVAALACLAARRVVLVGDPRQLSPITRMSRVLPSEHATWLSSSALMHLQPKGDQPKGVHILTVQHRMHSGVCSAVSRYQYGGLLVDAPGVIKRARNIGQYLEDQPRAIWYVLDEDTDELHKIRAERGPGNRSWVRPWTVEVLDRLLEDPVLAAGQGLFLSPFAAQARLIKTYLGKKGLSGWHASTVHSRQGTEADFVIFDTVNAGSYGWSYDEWQRLINVGVSRARECCILLASRAEMQEPYLAALQPHLAPRVFRWRGSRYFWTEVPVESSYPVSLEIQENPSLLGSQLTRRKSLRPVLSKEQQRLSRLPVDGKPRLVRGVAGSGKTVVLAHWVREALLKYPDARFLVVYGNIALRHMFDTLLPIAWRAEMPSDAFPWGRVDIIHVMDLLNSLLGPFDLSVQSFAEQGDSYQYDLASEEYLKLCPDGRIVPRWEAIFIDEAQDFGPNSLRLISRLAKPLLPDDPSKRPVMIFYDNAQNVYHRKQPKWSQLGIDVQGRATVMEESFRSTRPITEFALNVLYRFIKPEADPDHRELVNRGLIERTTRSGRDWWVVRFNHVDGPCPTVHVFQDIQTEATAIGKRLVHWIRDEGVSPGDIRILCIGRHVRYWLQRIVKPQLEAINVNLVLAQAGATRGGRVFEPDSRTVVVTTPNSFKGWDSEVLIVAGVDDFTMNNDVFAHGLYTAMTRARSILAVYGQQSAIGAGKKIMPVMEDCLDLLVDGADANFVSLVDDMNDIVERLGEGHREWVEGIGRRYELEQEAIVSSEGEVLLEPLFRFVAPAGSFVCFGHEPPSRRIANRAEDLKFRVLAPGDSYE